MRQISAPQTKALLIATGTDPAEASRMLTPLDDQSVPEAVNLLKALANLAQEPKPANSLLHAAWGDLALWGELVQGELARTRRSFFDKSETGFLFAA
jgi:hypothetical protein